MPSETYPIIPFLLTALPGLALGWLLRWLLHLAWLKRDGQVETRSDRLIYMLGSFTQALAMGLSLTFLAIILVATRLSDARQLAGLTFLTAVVTAFLSAFLRELFRHLSRMDF